MLRLHVRNFSPRSKVAPSITHHIVLASPLALVPLGQRGGPGDLRRGTTERNTTKSGERRDVVCAVSQSDRGQIRQRAVRDDVLSFFTLTTLQVYSLPFLFLKPSSPPALQSVKRTGHELA